MSQTTSPGVPMTADSTDRRDALATEICAVACTPRVGGWCPDCERRADAVIKHLDATGPARDEGQEMRCPTCGVRPGYRCRTPANRVTGTHVARTRMNAAPDPRPDQDAPREDGPWSPGSAVPESAGLPLPGPQTEGVKATWGKDAEKHEHRMTDWNGTTATCRCGATRALHGTWKPALAARPVPPGPAATRDGRRGSEHPRRPAAATA